MTKISVVSIQAISKSTSNVVTWVFCLVESFSLPVEHVFVRVEVLWPSQPNGVMSSVVSLPNHMFTGQA